MMQVSQESPHPYYQTTPQNTRDSTSSVTPPSTAATPGSKSTRAIKTIKERGQRNSQSSPLQRRLNLLHSLLNTRLDPLCLSRNMWCHGRETTTPSWTPDCGLSCESFFDAGDQAEEGDAADGAGYADCGKWELVIMPTREGDEEFEAVGEFRVRREGIECIQERMVVYGWRG